VTDKPKVAFICVHNSCRSQIAEALGRYFAGDVFDSFSAGTEIVGQINRDAVAVIKDLHSINMEITQHPKLIAQLPPIDIVIKMGCEVACPYLPAKYQEDWGLEDPIGKNYEEFIKTANRIKTMVLELKHKIRKNSLY
jgi:arsenate reductase